MESLPQAADGVTPSPPPTQDELIALLDPERDYGDRSYEQVVAQVRRGKLYLRAGESLPQIIDARTHRIARGSGKPPVNGAPIQLRATYDFRKRAFDDADEAYLELRAGMKGKDAAKFHKIFWELFLGRPVEARDMQSADALAVLQELARRQQDATLVREVVITAGEQA